MTLRSSDLQSDSDLDSIRNSCDVIVRGRFFMDLGGFHVFYGSRSVFMIPSGFLSSPMVPGWFKSELSAAGAK